MTIIKSDRQLSALPTVRLPQIDADYALPVGSEPFTNE
jgi:hypothetical protein